jgi:hypothetical protein
LVSWKGYPISESTWERIENLDGALDLVIQYNQRKHIDLGVITAYKECSSDMSPSELARMELYAQRKKNATEGKMERPAYRKWAHRCGTNHKITGRGNDEEEQCTGGDCGDKCPCTFPDGTTAYRQQHGDWRCGCAAERSLGENNTLCRGCFRAKVEKQLAKVKAGGCKDVEKIISGMVVKPSQSPPTPTSDWNKRPESLWRK